MKLPRRAFLRLAAGLPRFRLCRVSQGRRPILRGRCASGANFQARAKTLAAPRPHRNQSSRPAFALPGRCMGRENHHAGQGCMGLIDSVHDEVGSLSIEELEAERDHVLLGLLELRNKRANMAARKAVAV